MQGTLLVYHYTWWRTANQNRPPLLSWNPNPCLSWGHIATVFISQHLLPLGLTIGQLILSNFQRFADDMLYFGILFVWSCLICPLECWESYLSESYLAFVSTFGGLLLVLPKVDSFCYTHMFCSASLFLLCTTSLWFTNMYTCWLGLCKMIIMK